MTSRGADLAHLKPIEWNRVGEMVYMPMWRARLKACGQALPECSIANLPATRDTLIRIGRATLQKHQEATEDDCLARAWQLLVAGIGVALAPLGWTPEALPGDEAILRRGDQELRVWSELTAVVEGKISPEQWADRCRTLGIHDVAVARAAR